MFFHHFLTCLRSLWKNRLYTILNISGLALGMTTTIFILIYTVHQLTFDRFHTNYTRISQIVFHWQFHNQDIRNTGLSPVFGPRAKDTPAVENYVRIGHIQESTVESDADHKFFEPQFLFADSSFFSVFSFKMVHGDYKLLGLPNMVVLTEQSAKKYFGDEDPIGKTITYNKKYPLEIIGVAKSAPSNSSIQFDFVASFPTLGGIQEEANSYNEERFSGGLYNTFLLLASSNESHSVIQNLERLTPADNKIELLPLADIHTLEAGVQSGSTTRLFIAIALIIFGLAILNYVNLTTSRATSRVREVGIRKIVGARRSSLLMQFFIESGVIVCSAFFIALLLVWALTPWFINMVQQRFDTSFLYSHLALIYISLLLIGCILISASYPAYVMSSYQPLDMAKSGPAGRGKSFLRRALTTLQFGTTMVLIICSLAVNKQLHFLRTKDIGINKDQVLVLSLDKDIVRHREQMKADLNQLTGVSSVAYATQSLFDGKGTNMISYSPDGKNMISTNIFDVDEDFFETLKVKWKVKAASIGNSYVVNDEALQVFGIKGDPIGARLVIDDSTMRVQGVFKDFNFTSLHSRIGPLTIRVYGNGSDRWLNTFSWTRNFYIRLSTDSRLSDNMAKIKNIYARYNPQSPFEYYFLDDAFNNLYTAEDRMAKLFQSFTIISIFIASLGLFGLVTYTAERKTKEIGIRKVMGATVRDITLLLSQEYAVLMIIGAIIAVPLAWTSIDGWLDDFPYRTTIPYTYAIIAALLALAIAALTVSFQVIRAALGNPVKSLGTE